MDNFRKLCFGILGLFFFIGLMGCPPLVINLPPPGGTDGPPATPTPGPLATPTPPPAPSPSPEPSSTPAPAPSPSPVATPTPVPTPSPVCIPKAGSPPQPLPLLAVSPVMVGACPPGSTQVDWKGSHLCFAKEDPTSTSCHPCAWLNEYDLRGGNVVLDGGWVLDEGRGYRDFFCRRTLNKRDILNDWEYFGVCAPRQLQAIPGVACPSPDPGPSAPPTGVSDVKKLLLLNYGKCEVGKPFLLTKGCKELLATATPKAEPPCVTGNCDAVSHGRRLYWHVVAADGTAIPIPDEGDTPVGACAVISPGPEELTFNRTIKPLNGGCIFKLRVELDAPDGMHFSKEVEVTVE